MNIAKAAKGLLHRATGEAAHEYPRSLASQGFFVAADRALVATKPQVSAEVRQCVNEINRVRAAVKAGDMNEPKLEAAQHAHTVATRKLQQIDQAETRLWNHPAPNILKERERIRVELTEIRQVQRDRLESVETAEKAIAAAETRLATLRASGGEQGGPLAFYQSLDHGRSAQEIEKGREALAFAQERLANLQEIVAENAKKMYALEKRRDELKRMAWGLPASADVD